MFTVVMCSPTHHVYVEVISGHAHKGFSCRRPNPLFNWFNFLSMGIVNISFQSIETGKYAIPTRQLNFHFAPLAVSYELFPLWNQRQLDFLSIEPSSILQEKSLWVASGKRAAKRPLCSLFWGSWHMLHYTVHVTLLCALWKSLEVLGRMTSSVRHTSHIML